MTLPNPTVQCAFGVNPGTVPTVSQWTDISAYVTVAGCARGRSSETDTFTPGTFTASLKNRDRRFDPDYTSSPYYPNVKPMVRLRYGLGYMPLVLADAPVAYWRLGESSGTTATDEVGSFNGTYVNSPTLGVSGRMANNTAVTFASASSQDITIGDISAADAGDATYAIWVKTSTASAQYAMSEGLSTSNNNQCRLGVNSSGKAIAEVIIPVPVTTFTVTGTTTINDGGWYHLALVKTGTTLRLYVNGREEGTAATGLGSFSVDRATIAAARASSTSNYWNGTLDEPAIWRRALTATEILEHYNEGALGMPDGWRFTGFVERWPQTWPAKANEAAVPITAVDGTMILEAAVLKDSVWELEVRADSPTHWWRLGEASGTTAVDTLNTLTPGTYNASPTLGETGLVAQDDTTSVLFDSIANAKRVDLLNEVAITSKPYSIEAWVKTNTTFGTSFEQGFIWFQGFDIVDGIFLYGVGSVYTQGAVVFHVAHAGGSDAVTSGSVVVDDQLPHHVVATFTGSTQKLYVDGVDVTSAAASSGLTTWRAGPVAISGNPATNTGGWQGWLQEIAIYNTALSSARVAAHYNAGKSGAAGAWGNQATGTRIGNVLDAISWPTSDRNLDTGNSTLQPTTLGVTAKSAIDTATRSEQGALFFQQDGKIRFRARQTILTSSIHTTSQATLGDGGGTEVPYMEIDRYDYSADKILNEVRGNRKGGTTQTATDSTSQSSYLKRVDDSTLRDLEVTTDGEIVDAVNWRLNHYKDPISRPLRIMVKPQTATEWNAVASREIGHRITLNRRPPGGGTISKDVLIEHIEDQVPQMGDYSFIFDVSPAEAQNYWILGTSQLGTDTRLGY